MAMTAGQCTANPVTGAAGRVFTKMQAKGAATLGFNATAFTAGTPSRDALAAMVECLVEGILEEIAANGEAYITNSKGGLQREVNNLGNAVATLAPNAEQSLPLR